MATVALSGIITPTNVVTATSTTTLTNKTLTAPTIASANLTTALTLAGAAGTNGQVLTSAGSGLPSWTTIASGLSAATQAEMEAASSNTVAATPSNTNFHPGVAKAWVNATVAGVVTSGRNITSVTDGGTGIVTVTIATDFSGTGYVITAGTVTSGGNFRIVTANIVDAGSFTARCLDFSASNADPDVWSFSCFGDQA